ncbi:MAG TPA: hypothetical protein VGQ62_14750, partial [Chloroflexota bacterium]|nr:hypothetical protein [Chloroflexota bacterium]
MQATLFSLTTRILAGFHVIQPGQTTDPQSVRQFFYETVHSCSRYWRAVLASTLLGLALGLGLSLITPPRYTAEALIIPTGTRTDVQFEPAIKTVGADTVAPKQSTPSSERLQALADLAASPLVEPGAIAALQRLSTPLTLVPGTLLPHIRVALKPRSEIVSINAEAETSAEAIDIVNAWSDSYIEAVGRLYGPDPGGQVLVNLHRERDAALVTAQAAEARLIESMQNDGLEAAQRELANKQHQLDILQSPYQSGAYAVSGETGAEVDLQSARDDYRVADLRTIDNIAQTLRHLDALRLSLLVLDQPEGASSTASTATAVTLAQAQLVSIADGVDSPLLLQLPGPSPSNPSPTVRGLIAAIDRSRATVAQALQARQTAYEAWQVLQIAQLDDDLRVLRAQAESAQAERQRLTFRRDLALTAYTALARHVQEQTIALSSTQSQVNMG